MENWRTNNFEHRRKGLSLTKTLEIIPKNFLRIIVKEHILKVKHNKTL